MINFMCLVATSASASSVGQRPNQGCRAYGNTSLPVCSAQWHSTMSKKLPTKISQKPNIEASETGKVGMYHHHHRPHHNHSHPSRVRSDRPVAASSNSLFKGLPSCLCLSGLQFSIMFGILLLLILVISRKEFDLYLFSFSSTGSTFNSSKMSSFLLSSNGVYPAVLKNFVLVNVNHF